MLQLRGYQDRSLDALEAYLRATVEHGAQKAFILQTNRPYRPTPQLPGLPYVCLRVPTGGGKTLMACHAVGIVGTHLLQIDRVVCLWLVPSNTIRDQTLAALRNRQHAYRQVLDARFDNSVRIMDLSEALYFQRGVLDGETCIIVSTLAAFRVEDTEGRKVYEESGALQHHFAGLTADQENRLERRENGSPICSLANVLQLRRPLVIVDEAHNARTPLSFDTLARFTPSCIIEFTATPETRHKPEGGLFASNVLHHVSAAELKAEEMIKLPIKLRTREDWKEVISDALQTQRMLENAAKEEEQESGEYIRPIILFQAQPKSKERQTLTVEVVKKSLIDDFKVPEDQIAIATGQTHEIEGIDLFKRTCRIRYIITIQALKEGWDCPFAYILCSVAHISSQRAVEQIMGRVLRMPGARRKRKPELNYAYAFAASREFIEAANALKDALVENGFERFETNRMVVPHDQQGSFFDDGALFAGPAASAGVEFDKREVFNVPVLAARVKGVLELFDESHFLDTPWNIAECDASLSEAELSTTGTIARAGELDVDDAGKIEIHFVEQLHDQLTLLAAEPGWTVASLANWLDRQIPHRDISQAQSSLFIHNAVTGLIDSREISVEQLARHKFRLRNTIEAKINEHRQLHQQRAYQRFLFGDSVQNIEVSPDLCLSFSEQKYSPNWYYEGGYSFQKHYFPFIGELKPEGEEFKCAVFLDELPQVSFWVRNLERRPDLSFWLQTSTDRFYPDFVAMLNDGRFLVVEYKGEDRWSNDDSREKRAVGELWGERSGGQCLFIMPKGTDWSAIKAVVSN